jgi:hypothetical protein
LEREACEVQGVNPELANSLQVSGKAS